MQDIIIGYARQIDGTHYYRIQDTFTPSRSSPLLDYMFGGHDDIADAVGIETDYGHTLLKFRRPLATDGRGDYCLLKGIKYRAVYALGQVGAWGLLRSEGKEPCTGASSGMYAAIVVQLA